MKIKYAGLVLKGVWPAGAFFFGALAGLVSSYFLILLLAHFFMVGMLIGRLRCPTCGRPVYLRELKGAIGPHDRYWSPFMARHCLHCGTDLMRANFDWKMFGTGWKPLDTERAWTTESKAKEK